MINKFRCFCSVAIFIAVLFCFNGCQSDTYYPELLTIEMINKLQECEENNLHYTILGVLKGSPSVNLTNQIILPRLDRLIDNDLNNEILFPAQSLERTKVRAEGYYSIEPHSEIADGCKGSHQFKIAKIIEVIAVDTLFDYPINNR